MKKFYGIFVKKNSEEWQKELCKIFGHKWEKYFFYDYKDNIMDFKSLYWYCTRCKKNIDKTKEIR